MNINHFAYFVEAVRENSITKAAESLFISQSTISKAIKCLEQASALYNFYATSEVDEASLHKA